MEVGSIGLNLSSVILGLDPRIHDFERFIDSPATADVIQGGIVR